MIHDHQQDWWLVSGILCQSNRRANTYLWGGNEVLGLKALLLGILPMPSYTTTVSGLPLVINDWTKFTCNNIPVGLEQVARNFRPYGSPSARRPCCCSSEVQSTLTYCTPALSTLPLIAHNSLGRTHFFLILHTKLPLLAHSPFAHNFHPIFAESSA